MASFGENLRRERELRGVDLHEMAEATKISIRFLQALEQDRVDVLPGGIFPRAFVRQYGKYLGLDPERLVAEFVFAYGGEPAAARAPAAVPDGVPRRSWIVGAVVLLVAALAAWALWPRSPEAETAAASPSPMAPPPTFPQDRVYPPPAAVAATPVPAAVIVGLVVRRRAWVEARVDGSTVVNRVMEAGEGERLEAREAVTLAVGDAGGVEYTLNGQPGGPLGRDGEVRRNIVITAAGVAPVPLSRPSPRPRRPSPSPPSEPAAAPAAPAGDASPPPADR
jgi:transcriptional regulator with XRE-family HTH domain